MPKSPSTPADDNAVLQDVVRLFLQAQRTLTACCSDVTSKESEALLLLGRTDPLSVQAFAGRMELEKTWASRLLVRLEKRGLIRRRPNPADGRGLLIELTSRGRKEHAALHTALSGYAVNLMGCVPAGERESVRRALVQLRNALTECMRTCAPSSAKGE